MPPYDILKQRWKFDYMDFSELRGKFKDIANVKEDKMDLEVEKMDNGLNVRTSITSSTGFLYSNPLTIVSNLDDVACIQIPVAEGPSLFCNRASSGTSRPEDEKPSLPSPRNIELRITDDYYFWFNTNHVIYKKSWRKERKCLTLPKGIDANENKFGAVCHAIVDYFMTEYNKHDGFFTPVWTYTDPNTHETTVRFSDGDEVSCKPTDMDLLHAVSNHDYFGQDICYAKKIVGGTSGIRRIVDVCDFSERKKKIRQLNKELDRKLKEENLRYEKKNFEFEVKNKMKRLRIEREANRRLDIEEAKKSQE